MCGPHRGSSTVAHSVACGLGEHSATLKIALTVVQHGISLLLNRDLISQEGLLRSGVVSGLEQNGQVTRIWPSPPCSCNSLPVVPPLPEISLKRTNRCKMALDALGRRSRDWGHGGFMEQWLELRVPYSCVFPSPHAFSPCMWLPHTFVASLYIQPGNLCFTLSGRLCPENILFVCITLPLSSYPQHHFLSCY